MGLMLHWICRSEPKRYEYTYHGMYPARNQTKAGCTTLNVLLPKNTDLIHIDCKPLKINHTNTRNMYILYLVTGVPGSFTTYATNHLDAKHLLVQLRYCGQGSHGLYGYFIISIFWEGLHSSHIYLYFAYACRFQLFSMYKSN